MSHRCVKGVAALIVAAVAAWPTSRAGADEGAWRYVVGQDQGFPSGGRRLARLSNKAPDEVAIDVAPRGTTRFTQIRYGAPDSDRVAVMIDEYGGGFDLYVDANRDRQIDGRDQVAGQGEERTCHIEAEIVGADGKLHAPRQVSLRYHQRRLLYGTAGYVQGKLILGSREISVRRVDMDSNGLMTDPADCVWLDLDNDGQWHALTEQFPYRPVLRLDGRRFALASDLLGRRLSAAAIEGTGQVRLQLADVQLAERVSALSVVLAGKDGTLAHVNQLDQPCEVPIGEYELLSVVVTMTQPETPKSWTFVFSNMQKKDVAWHEVARDQTHSIDPLGRLEFLAELSRNSATAAPGETILISPRLYTGDRLQLQTSYWGSDPSGADGQPQAVVFVRAKEDSAPLSVNVSGFA